MTFEEKIAVRWADVDQNRHVRHSAYYDYGAHCRIRFFEKLGFGIELMAKNNLGPIIFHEQCSFLKELHSTEVVTINLKKGPTKADGSRWVIHHEIFNTKGEKAAHLTIKGAWMDLTKRKLTIPPSEIAQGFAQVETGEDFVYKKS